MAESADFRYWIGCTAGLLALLIVGEPRVPTREVAMTSRAHQWSAMETGTGPNG